MSDDQERISQNTGSEILRIVGQLEGRTRAIEKALILHNDGIVSRLEKLADRVDDKFYDYGHRLNSVERRQSFQNGAIAIVSVLTTASISIGIGYVVGLL